MIDGSLKMQKEPLDGGQKVHLKIKFSVKCCHLYRNTMSELVGTLSSSEGDFRPSKKQGQMIEKWLNLF